MAARLRRPPRHAADIIALNEVPFAAVEADDATVFPAPRSAFLRAWIGSPGHAGCAVDARRPACRLGRDPSVPEGFKIGPLVADDRAGAEAVLSAP